MGYSGILIDHTLVSLKKKKRKKKGKERLEFLVSLKTDPAYRPCIQTLHTDPAYCIHAYMTLHTDVTDLQM